MNTQSKYIYIYEEVEKERDYQQQRWGDTVDDTHNTPWMWCAYIAGYATKWMVGTFLPLDRSVTNAFRKCMVNTATVCIAAIESVDRQREEAGKTFYEQ